MELQIFYFILYFIEGITLYVYGSTIFTSSFSKRKQIISIIVSYLVLCLLSNLNIPGLNVILFLLINFLLILYLYRTKITTALFHSAMITTVMGLSELVLIGLSSYFPVFSFIEYSSHVKLITTALSSKIIYFFTLYLLSYFSQKEPVRKNKFDISILFLILIPIISSFVMLTLLTTSKSFNSSTPSDFLISLSAIGLILVNILIWILYGYNLKRSNELIRMQLSLQKESDMLEYYKMINLQNKNQNMLIHDIKKHLQSILLLNKNHESEKIDAYIERIISSGSLKTSVRICDNELLNAILCRYTVQCEAKKISFHIDIRSEVINFLAEDEITSLFCNLIDNAVESAEKATDSYIDLSVSRREDTNWIIITQKNSCPTKPMFNANKELVTSKPDSKSHGFGLKSINRIVDEHHGKIQTYYVEETQMFHTVIMLLSPSENL